MAAKKQPKKFTVSTPVYGVSLRAEPNGKILDIVIPNGDMVEVKSEKDGWIEVDGGWIRAEYLK